MTIEKGLSGYTLCLAKDELWDFIWVQNPDKSSNTSNKCRMLIEAVDQKPNNRFQFLPSQRKWVIERLKKCANLYDLFSSHNITDLRVE
jgi:hypothetical protein